MQSKAKTVERYLAELPAERRETIAAIREIILKNLPKGYEEGMQYGMIGYYVPHSIYPNGYHCDPRQPLPFASIASQKNHMAIYLMCLYGSPEHEAWFRSEWAKSGKKLDMGKSCVRFKKLEDVPLKVVGTAVKRVPVKKFIERYESVLASAGRRSGKPAVQRISARPTGKKDTRKATARPATRQSSKSARTRKS